MSRPKKNSGYTPMTSSEKSAYLRKLRADRKANHLCVWCNKKLDDGYAFLNCEDCRKRSSKLQKKHVDKNSGIGLCKCGNEFVVGNVSHLCEECILRSCASRFLGSTGRWVELSKKFNDQFGLCAYTGLPITIGIDATLDHIKPKSRHPELASDINNLQWVSHRVNMMKTDMSEQEFFAMIDILHTRIHQG